MLNSLILSYITFAYFVSFLLYLFMLVMRKERFGRMASVFTLATLLAHTLAIILRWMESYQMGIGHAPLSNLYESLIFFAWAIIFLYLITEWRTKNKILGVFAAPMAFLAMAYASFSPGINSRIQPLFPALKSNWLIAHVITCFFGYAAFGLAFCISLIYLLKKMDSPQREKSFLKSIPSLSLIDELTYQMVIIGFLLLTLGIITGSVWAHSAWGRYWGWDPKEVWSLVTWLVYAALLHSHTMLGWKGKRLAIFSIIGFSCVLFTYFGVNYLPGLHSYGQK